MKKIKKLFHKIYRIKSMKQSIFNLTKIIICVGLNY